MKQEHTDKNTLRKRKVRRYRILLILCLLAAGAALFYLRYAPTKTVMDPEEYFTSQMVAQGGDGVLKENELAIVLQDHVETRKAVLDGNELYLAYSLVQDTLNSRFYWDDQNGMMLYTNALETYEIPVNSMDYTIDGTAQKYDHEILLAREDGKYLNAAFLQQYTNLEYHVFAESKHVLIEYQWGERLSAQAKRKTAVRYTGGIKGLVLTQVEAGDAVTILETLEKWSRVVTPDGFIGYLPNKAIEEPEARMVERSFTPQEYPALTRDETINLIWHRIDNAESNNYLRQDTKAMTGVNVISPTWFSLTDDKGHISSLSSKSYVARAHRQNLEVWGLVSNFQEGVSTTAMLKSTTARRTFVSALVEEALESGMDGINLDLEAITEEAGYSYVQLVRELSIACRKNSLVLSVDIPVPMSWNAYYDRAELGCVADYVIIMGYDEHYVGSDAGSVASIGFEKKGIEGTLASVPPEKIISGVPFYSRLWYLSDAGDGTLTVDYSEAYGMSAVTKILEQNEVTPVWDEETAQNFATWVNADDGLTRQIWIEDETSLAKKADLVKDYSLGGIAAWALGFERDAVWDVITEHISEHTT